MAVAAKFIQSTTQPRLWQPARLTTAWIKRLGWQLKAYAPILGILVLMGLSLVVLRVHWTLSKWIKSSKQDAIQIPRDAEA